MNVEDRVAALEAELSRLRNQLGDNSSVPSSRREVFKKVGAVAAGALAGGTALAVAGANAAGAADNSAFNQGSGQDANNTFTTRTGFFYNGATLTTDNALTVSDQPGFIGNSVYPAALAGWASGSNKVKHGVYGFTPVAAAYGVVCRGTSSTDGSGFLTDATGALLQGGRANLELNNAGTAPPSRSDAHSRGELVADSTGAVWYCVAAGTPGTWRKLSGPSVAVGGSPAVNGTPTGVLHVLDAPQRVYDSRTDAAGKLALDQERVVDLSSRVPQFSSSALFNLTSTRATTTGFLAAFSAAVTWPGHSNLNFQPNMDIANLVVSAIDGARKIKVRCGGATGVNTDFIVDVIGFYA